MEDPVTESPKSTVTLLDPVIYLMIKVAAGGNVTSEVLEVFNLIQMGAVNVLWRSDPRCTA